MERICVYCGSNLGRRPSYLATAQALGQELAARHLTLVYGGGNVGLMGAIADATLAAGGEAIGVIPQALVDKEVAHRGLSDLRVVNSMHDRKALMAELSDAFIALPGGLGTLEELCEVATWTQLGFHQKAVGLLNVEGFYDGLLGFLEGAIAEQFIRPEHRRILISATQPGDLLDQLAQAKLPTVAKWIGRGEE
ncbi:TIGR00730 family Rossman fold protein [filamentous cyanobacterium CCP3]|nr:TIGR00730 family Rossman fold protein [filamentous cyanobacterium CCP3]